MVKNVRAGSRQPKNRQSHGKSGKCRGRSALHWEVMAKAEHEEWVGYKNKTDLGSSKQGNGQSRSRPG